MILVGVIGLAAAPASRPVEPPPPAAVEEGPAPRLELRRVQEEQALLAAGKTAADLHVTTDFECARPAKVRQLSPNHVAVVYPDRTYFLHSCLFRLTGVAGRTVRVDFQVANPATAQRATFNPLFTDATDLSDPATYRDGHESGPDTLGTTAWNGPALPATHDQSWHYLADCWNPTPQTVSVVHHFDHDCYVSVRVPRPPSYDVRYFASLARNPNVTAVEIAKSAGGRPLLLARVGPEGTDRPVVLVYAAGVTDEPDGMWAAEGALDFVAGDSAAARDLRQRFTFLVLPEFDPDAVAACLYYHFENGFSRPNKVPETIAYAEWFDGWVARGNRLDAALDLCNGGFAAPSDLAPWLMEKVGDRGLWSMALHKAVVTELAAHGYTAAPRPWARGWYPHRLGGWAAMWFGTLTMNYMLDSESSARHRNLADERDIGAALVRATCGFLTDTPTGTAVMAAADARRTDRAAEIAKFRPRQPGEDAITYEAALSESDPADVARVKQEKIPTH